jgi:hypothetical protein
MSNLISEHYSNDRLKVAMVFSRSTSYRVLCLDSYFETQKEFYFEELNTAEDFAEDWVL